MEKEENEEDWDELQDKSDTKKPEDQSDVAELDDKLDIIVPDNQSGGMEPDDKSDVAEPDDKLNIAEQEDTNIVEQDNKLGVTEPENKPSATEPEDEAEIAEPMEEIVEQTQVYLTFLLFINHLYYLLFKESQNTNTFYRSSLVLKIEQLRRCQIISYLYPFYFPFSFSFSFNFFFCLIYLSLVIRNASEGKCTPRLLLPSDLDFEERMAELAASVPVNQRAMKATRSTGKAPGKGKGTAKKAQVQPEIERTRRGREKKTEYVYKQREIIPNQ